MFDFYEILTGLGIAVSSILLSGFIVTKYIQNEQIIENIIINSIETIIKDAQTNESMQKDIYTVGALLGNGIAAGSGMNKSLKGGGKLTLNNIIAEIASNWIQQKTLNPSPSPLQPTLSPSTQTLTTDKVSDKW